MNAILVFSENLALARELITCAWSIQASVQAVTINEKDALELSEYPLDKVHFLKSASSRSEDYAQPLADLVSASETPLLLVGDTVSGRELAAKTASLLCAGLAAGINTIRTTQAGFDTERMVYGGAALKVERFTGLLVATVPSGKYEAAVSSGRKVDLLTTEVVPDQRIKVLQTKPIPREGVDISASDIVVGVGLGFNKKEDLSLAFNLANVFGGVVGCTRPVAEDKKWLPVEQYIGISGVNIAPRLYLCIGISGQIQHMVGVRDSKILVAINKNETAPIFQAIDYGIVGDLYEILPLLTETIRKK
jgi:electron transfer flavoprotein alpha subunit